MAATMDFSSPVRAPKLPFLTQLHEVLQPPECPLTYGNTNGLRSFVLCGFGGVGKTQIAIHYANSEAHQYDAIFWVQADGVDKLAKSFRDIAVELQLIEAAEASDPIINRNIVMKWLSAPYKGFLPSNHDVPETAQEYAKWLIVFDNADKPELLRDFWPASGNGSALVTSRDPLAKVYLHPACGLDLQPFMREEAAHFLARLSASNIQSDADSESTFLLSDRLGGFPLALVHVAAIIRREGLNMEEMLEHYDGRALHSEIYQFTDPSPHDKYTHTLSTVWELEDLSSPALHLLETIAFMDPDAINESIVQMRLDKYPSEDFGYMPESYEDAIISLASASLIKRDMDRKQLTVHRVVQEGTRNRMSTQRFTLVFGHVVELLLNSWYHEPEEKFTHLKALWDVANLVSPHATHIKSVYDRSGPDLDPDITFAFARLLQKNGWFLFETGFPKSAAPLLELALRLCDGLPSKTYSDCHGQDEQVLLADVLFCLASLSSDHNQPADALRYAERHFEVRMMAEKRKQTMSRHSGLAYTELGLAYILNERFEDAIMANRAGRALLMELPLFKEGKYWPDFAVIHEVIALIGLERDAEALPMLQEAIAFRERRFGPNDTQSFKLGLHLQLSGLVYLRKGDQDTSFQYYQRALANYRATVGDHHYRTSQVCVKLAEYHAINNQAEAASIYFDQALKNFAHHDLMKPELALAKHKKAKFMHDFGDFEAAEELAKEARQLYMEVVSANHATAVDTPCDDDFEEFVPFWSR
ncbi:MAG: hypothetical protein LQ349_003855 [Xanthoria aureola]|nr:MAG: hypothetical protein LQ349_003855 [Xanthoria aureola]